MTRTRAWSAVAGLAVAIACVALVVGALEVDSKGSAWTLTFIVATFVAGWAWVLRTPGLWFYSVRRVETNRPHWIAYARASGWLLAAEVAVALLSAVPAVSLDRAGWRWLFVALVAVPLAVVGALLFVPLSMLLVASPVRLVATRTGPALRGDRPALATILVALAVLAFVAQGVLLDVGAGDDPAAGAPSSRSGRTAHSVAILLGLSDPDFGGEPWALWAARGVTVAMLLLLAGAAAIGLRQLATPAGTGVRAAR